MCVESPVVLRRISNKLETDLTTVLLVTASYFPLPSAQINSLALSAPFISGIGTYIGHLDHSVRRCGMLVAEVIAQRAGKKLDFGDWEGNDACQLWAKEVKQLINARDIDADLQLHSTDGNDDEKLCAARADSDGDEVQEPQPNEVVLLESHPGYDSDDSLTGYASPTSTRSPSPTRSELDEIEKDPTLRVGTKKVHRPVYLTQLGEMVRSTAGPQQNDATQEADKMEMALNCAEALIRRRRDYGTELGAQSSSPASHFILYP